MLAPRTNGNAPGNVPIDDNGIAFTNGVALAPSGLIDQAAFTLTPLGYGGHLPATLPWDIKISGMIGGIESAMQRHQLSATGGAVKAILLAAPGLQFDAVSIQLDFPNGCLGAPCAQRGARRGPEGVAMVSGARRFRANATGL